MTKKKDPKKDPIAPPTPEEVIEAMPMEVLMDALAKVSGELQGKKGAELRKHVSAIKSQVETVVAQTQRNVQDHESRKAIGAEVERLVDTVARTGSVVGQAVAKQREPIVAAFRGVDLSSMAEGLRVFADWLQNPSDEGAARVQELVEQLQKTMGPLVGYDPKREEAERKAAIQADVKASLDEIFRGVKKPT